jgi:alkylation response protein AidB-like acyl-CoA dehydrogenase
LDLDLSEDQKMLRKAARDFLANECSKQFVRQMELDEKGYSPELWGKIAELGWLGLPFPESYDGGGGSLLDLVILLEEMGRAILPSPYLPSVVMSGLTILSAGSDDQKQRYLPAISRGEIFTFALTESDGGYDPASIKTMAAQGKGEYVISGAKLFVPYAHVADHMLCLARTSAGPSPEDGLSLFVVDAGSPGVSSAVLSTIASDKQCEVVLDGAMVPAGNVLGQPGGAWPIVEKTLQWAAIAKCAEMVGAAQQVLEMSVAYAKERVQFDRPIGTFQAVQHHCANMLLDVDGMRYLTYEAAWLLSSGLPAVKEVAMAKTWVSEAIGRVVRLGHQIHGGVGYTIDHDLQLYYRRGKAAQALFGDASFHREVIAGHLGL